MSKIDRTKKYVGWGYTMEFRYTALSDVRVPIWRSIEINFKGEPLIEVDEPVMHAWLDAGHIRPVKEKKIMRVEGVVFVKPPAGNLYSEFMPTHYAEIPDHARSRPVTLEFEVEA